MLRLLTHAGKYKKKIILGSFFKIMESIFELFLPLMMKNLVDDGIREQKIKVIYFYSLLMTIFTFFGLFTAIIGQYYASIASQGFGTMLRNKLFKKINNLSYKQIDIIKTETLVTRITNDINQIQLSLSMFIRLMIRIPFLIIGSTLITFFIDSEIGMLCLILLFVICASLYFVIDKSILLYDSIQRKIDCMNRIIFKHLSGIKTIRSFVQEKNEIQKFNKSENNLSNSYIRAANISTLLSPLITLIMNIGICVVFYLSGIKINMGCLTQGELLVIVNYINKIIISLIVMSQLIIIFTKSIAAEKRIINILTLKNNRDHGKKIKKGSGNIIFSKVNFKFNKQTKFSLENINFSVDGGTTLGIVGANGSGKSSLVELIPRFYDVYSGSIKVNNLDINQWKIKELRKRIAIVPQKNVLFKGTIRENLQWGKKDATSKDCWKALEMAQIIDFVSSISTGLDTKVYENGKNFSGGQKQRLAIARALISDPEILILDDPFNSLDNQTESNLKKELKKLLCTTIIISQKIVNIKDSNKILVLDSGKIVGQGNHENLMKTSKEYFKIMKSQEEI